MDVDPLPLIPHSLLMDHGIMGKGGGRENGMGWGSRDRMGWGWEVRWVDCIVVYCTIHKVGNYLFRVVKGGYSKTPLGGWGMFTVSLRRERVEFFGLRIRLV